MVGMRGWGLTGGAAPSAQIHSQIDWISNWNQANIAQLGKHKTQILSEIKVLKPFVQTAFIMVCLTHISFMLAIWKMWPLMEIVLLSKALEIPAQILPPFPNLYLGGSWNRVRSQVC